MTNTLHNFAENKNDMAAIVIVLAMFIISLSIGDVAEALFWAMPLIIGSIAGVLAVKDNLSRKNRRRARR